MRIEADKDRCVGAGQCTLTAPEVFDSGDDGLVKVLREHPDESQAGDVREAAALCPAQAITLRESGSDGGSS